MKLEFKEISFSEILPLWQKLWDEDSPKTHSSMLFNSKQCDMNVYTKPVKFFGAFSDNKLIGCNSIHEINEYEIRSRGLYVDPAYRGKHIGSTLLKLSLEIGSEMSGLFCWSMPRLSALNVYLQAGFIEEPNSKTDTHCLVRFFYEKS